MSDFDNADDQDAAWRAALQTAGIPVHRLNQALDLAQRIASAIDADDWDVIERVQGFGDITRGLATIATVAVLQEHEDKDMGDVSDGFHTFNQLYAHRMALTAALFRALDGRRSGISPWRSLLHHDGRVPFGEGWFIVGVTLPGVGQISYHYPLRYWHDFDIPGVLTLELAEPYDGHEADDVVLRLLAWAVRNG